MTDTDVQGRRIRRPARLGEIEAITGANDEKLRAIIELLRGGGRSFVNLTEDRDDPLIDITHESLIRKWGRLQQWVDGEAASREMYLELVKDARAHRAGRKSLLRGHELTLTLDWRSREKPNEAWARRYHPDFPDAIRFLDQSAQRRAYKRLARWAVVAAVVIAVPFLLNWRRQQELAQQARQLEQQRTELAKDIAEQAEVLTEEKRINHVIVLMLENRSFDHFFGFFKPPAGQKSENLLGANSTKSNLLDPSKPQSAKNPCFPRQQAGALCGPRQGRSISLL